MIIIIFKCTSYLRTLLREMKEKIDLFLLFSSLTFGNDLTYFARA